MTKVPIFWTGRLSPGIRMLMNTSNALAWLTGNARDTTAMKQRVKLGYEGKFTDHVTRYDELGLDFQIKAARAQLQGVSFMGKEVLDVGAGTGAVSFLALEYGAAKVVCGDISEYMLEQCRKKARMKGLDDSRIDFVQLDAETLPFGNDKFDITITGMTLGLIPNQSKAISEMFRVTKPGGTVSVGAHGPEHYWESIDAYLKSITKRYVLGYRLEFWPKTEKQVERMLFAAGLSKVQTGRVIWRNEFANGGEAFDFFAAISATFWYAKFPKDKRRKDYEKVRKYFVRKHKTRITDDIVLGYGQKPTSNE
jgi:ubiquinone/menaquinone biosynthesis C-methylase UbiE